ncbi:hypothetical protein GDO81_014345 [Engystomops pustulosus]|uniref:C-type lectin domain-containing protein n=1 Tax=Engystomops pustulosus TaxID=76066 RepID=A0AAV7BA94_ENGPU|nr:hypothetical protein GDO81_014345 [Engystomops pustulosus]
MMDLLTALVTIVAVYIHCCRGTRLQSGQIVCKQGTQKPCYKIIYFHDTSRRLSFHEAQDECKRDGGHLMTIKSEAEQKFIQKLIQSLTGSDGDFWLGLRRIEDDSPNSSDCQSQYTWVDGKSNLHFILIATIPVLTLLLIFIGVLCCCFIERRKQERSEAAVKEPSFWLAPNRRNSPNLEIYNVIKRQTEADLTGTRPNIRNTSFRGPSGDMSPPDNLSGDYDNIAGHHSESGFVTLASTESGFVTNELYELCTDKYGRSTESGWVENEIYGY